MSKSYRFLSVVTFGVLLCAIVHSIGCGNDPGPQPDGSCVYDDQCRTDEFCLRLQCFGAQTVEECKSVFKCAFRTDVGGWCDSDDGCVDGTICDLPKDCDGGPCSGSTCIEGVRKDGGS